MWLLRLVGAAADDEGPGAVRARAAGFGERAQALAEAREARLGDARRAGCRGRAVISVSSVRRLGGVIASKRWTLAGGRVDEDVPAGMLPVGAREAVDEDEPAGRRRRGRRRDARWSPSRRRAAAASAIHSGRPSSVPPSCVRVTMAIAWSRSTARDLGGRGHGDRADDERDDDETGSCGSAEATAGCASGGLAFCVLAWCCESGVVN